MYFHNFQAIDHALNLHLEKQTKKLNVIIYQKLHNQNRKSIKNHHI